MTHEILLTFFQKILKQDAKTIEAIAQSKEQVFIDQETGVLVFSLLSLYELVFDKQILSFTEFKKNVYQGSFNQSLQALGGVVSVYQSYGKVDDNLYQFSALVNK